MRGVSALLSVVVLLGASARVQANGAFPDSMQILLPSDKPHQVMVGTNFGLLISEDDGASWRWLCEELIAPCARLYQVNAPPSDTVFSITSAGLVRLTDGACSQDIARGLLQGSQVTDVFPDPNDPAHVLAVGAAVADGGSSAYTLFESRDTGKTFGTALYGAPQTVNLSGVEIARSDSRTVYLTQYGLGAQPIAPTVLRSANGGNTFQAFDQSQTLGNTRVSIAAVDPSDPQKIYLRTTNPATMTDALAVSENGGMSFTIPLTLPATYQMTAFLKRADGTILVTALQPMASNGSTGCGATGYTGDIAGAGYLSTDGGHSFTPWAGAPHVRALGERGALLYAVGNNFADGFAVATSTDLGAHWTPILRFDQIAGPLQCAAVASGCASAWATLMSTFGIGAMEPPTPPPGTGGCGCSLAPTYELIAWPVLLVLLLGWAYRKRTARTQKPCGD